MTTIINVVKSIIIVLGSGVGRSSVRGGSGEDAHATSLTLVPATNVTIAIGPHSLALATRETSLELTLIGASVTPLDATTTMKEPVLPLARVSIGAPATADPVADVGSSLVGGSELAGHQRARTTGIERQGTTQWIAITPLTRELGACDLELTSLIHDEVGHVSESERVSN